jgi:hypothetical protein
MKSQLVKNVAAATIMGLAWTLATPVRAGIRDYEFQLVESQVKKSETALLAVRLVDKRSGGAVPNAVIFAQRLDMAPDGMETMTAPIEPLPASEPGVYRFKANLTAAGGWRLSLSAKIQSETGTLESALPFRVLP